MSLSSLQLDAFVAVAQFESFSRAAKSLNITQSALSQRILNLEDDLGSTLFIREPAGIRLTELGRKLVRYCQMKDSLEAEFLGDLGSRKGTTLGGLVRVGGFSTVTRSIIVPSLSRLMVENPAVQLELHTREVRDLPALLETGKADFILMNRSIEKKGVENVRLGFEENVLVESQSGNFRSDVFLDHDSEDSTTADFWKIQSKSPAKWKRSYFDEIYAIIDGVLLGTGRAVVPLHLVKQFKGLAVAKGFRALKTPVFLCYYQQAFYTSLQNQVLATLKTVSPGLLKPR